MGRGRLRALTGFKSVYEPPCLDHGYLVNRGAPPGGSNEGLKDLEALGIGGHSIGIEPLIHLGDDVGCVTPCAESEAAGCAT